MLGFPARRRRIDALATAAGNDARAAAIARRRVALGVHATLTRPSTLAILFATGYAIGWLSPRGSAVRRDERADDAGGTSGDDGKGAKLGGLAAQVSKLTAAVIAGARLYQRFAAIMALLDEPRADSGGRRSQPHMPD